MSLSRKVAFGAAVLGAFATTAVGAGTANAEGDSFGALAAVIDRATGQMVGYGWGIAADPASAEATALNECGKSDCAIVLNFQNECAAIARYQGRPAVWAVGPTRAEAESNAITVLGPEPGFLGSIGIPQLGKSACTANTR